MLYMTNVNVVSVQSGVLAEMQMQQVYRARNYHCHSLERMRLAKVLGRYSQVLQN